jgi:sec-independent protein translocase protein TatA
MEILLILGVALLLFGAGRIADIGKGLGEGIRNFKKGIKDDEPPKLPPKKDDEAAGGAAGGEDQKA